MKTRFILLSYSLYSICIALGLFSCSVEESDNPYIIPKEIQDTITHTDEAIATRYAPVFYQDVDIRDGWCRDQSISGSADWITAVDYDGDWNTSNNWENMVSARDSGRLIPYVYYYVTYTETHFFVLYSVYHPRDWTNIALLCSLDTHENDMEAVLVTAIRKSNGGFGSVINAQSIWHAEVYDYFSNEIKLKYPSGPKMYIQAKGHGIRAYQGFSDQDGTYIEYYCDSISAVSPDKDPNHLPQSIHYNLLPLESTLWLQRNNPLTITGTALVGDNGDGSNKASSPWGWENGLICKNPAQYLKDKYGWTGFSTDYISDTPIQ